MSEEKIKYEVNISLCITYSWLLKKKVKMYVLEIYCSVIGCENKSNEDPKLAMKI